ncbi:hypothetical protein BXU06_16035 [Aquaspirillum sp. LM1]|uniref:helix-turn-helix domain-containing protein n=1 Tax=Aquaspirillum sp. LM1 TaxID=1938604 RepID=UPI000983BC0F|nr:helix-turn-helix domain-containing protein [Aquaspirillum sp. LM1]AQR66386.1 hypothetical protein BXU06_16035 [Aquaspirillum sp. LM1]
MTKKGEDRLPIIHFTSHDLSADENYTVWCQATDALFDIDFHGADHPVRFQADLTSYSMGSILLGRTRSVAQRFSRSTATIARSGIDHIIVQLYMVGGYHGHAGSASIVVQAGDICVLDCAETFATQASDFENLTLVIPRAILETKLPRLEALHGLVLKAGSTWNRILSQHLLVLFEQAPSMTLRECERIANGSIALLAACLQGEIEARDEQTASASVTSMVLQIRRHIDAHLSDPALGADQVAARFALSRATLYRLFEPLGGVADYIRARRLRRAFFALRARELANLRISEIAQRCGFASMATFTRAFKAAYGITPAALRSVSALNPTSPALHDATQGEALSITRWMHEITADKSG